MKLEKEFKEVFDFYSVGSDPKNKTIPFEEIGVMTDKMELVIKDEELKLALSKINDMNTENIPYSGFVELFEHKLYEEVKKEEAIKAFELFDKNKSGKILIEDFHHVLHNLCEQLTKKESDHFLELANMKGDGGIYYKEFVDFLFS